MFHLEEEGKLSSFIVLEPGRVCVSVMMTCSDENRHICLCMMPSQEIPRLGLLIMVGFSDT